MQIKNTDDDFSDLDLSDDDRRAVGAHTLKIRQFIQNAGENIIGAGLELIQAKARFKHGEFVNWLDTRFGWSRMTANRLMNVAKAFKSNNLLHLDIAPSALYLLAAPSTPDAVREKFVKQAETKPVAHKEVKAAIDTAKKSKPRKKATQKKKPAKAEEPPKKKEPEPKPPENDMDFKMPRAKKKHKGKALFSSVRGAVSSKYQAVYRKKLDWDKDARILTYLVGEIIEKAIEDKKAEILGDVKEHVEIFCEKMEEGKIKEKYNPQTLLKQWDNLTRYIDAEETKRLSEGVGGKEKQGEMFK